MNKLVWNVHISPQEFEEKWNSMIRDYDVVDDSWFKEMY